MPSVSLAYQPWEVLAGPVLSHQGLEWPVLHVCDVSSGGVIALDLLLHGCCTYIQTSTSAASFLLNFPQTEDCLLGGMEHLLGLQILGRLALALTALTFKPEACIE